ncbi:hypothetical protein Droror1_Dr00008747 [Drosera rotundifolia]
MGSLALLMAQFHNRLPLLLKVNSLPGYDWIRWYWLGSHLLCQTKCSSKLFTVPLLLKLVTTFKIVPRGTKGAISIEGTVAGLVASVLLAFVGYRIDQINAIEVALCVIASRLANLGESVIGASLQDKDGFRWLNNEKQDLNDVETSAAMVL